MNKFLLLSLALLFASGLMAQTEDFEGCTLSGEETLGTLPDGWSRFFDGSDENPDKAWKPVTENAHVTGEGADTLGIALKMNEWFVAADIWLVTKQFTPAADGQFKFWATDSGWKPSDDGGDDSDRVKLEVYVCTAEDQPEFSDDFEVDPILVVEENDNSDYEEYTIDLSAYKGTFIYVGFKVANQSTWSDSWWIDDVSGLATEPATSAKETVASKFSVYPNPSNGAVTLENLKGGVVTVYNMTGKEVKRFVNVKNNESINLDVESGVYFVTNNGVAKKINIVK